MSEFRAKEVLGQSLRVFAKYPGHFLVSAFFGGLVGPIFYCFSIWSQSAKIGLAISFTAFALNGITLGFMVGLAGAAVQGRKPDLSANFRNIIPKIPSLAGANLLWSLFMAVLLFPSFSMLQKGHIAFSLFALCTIIGAIMFWALICLWTPCVVFLGERPLSSFARSLRLTKGRSVRMGLVFLAVLGALTAASIILEILLAMALGSRFQSGQIILPFGELNAIVFRCFQSFITGFTGMLLGIPITVMFLALRREKVSKHDPAPGWELRPGDPVHRNM